jgi:hypothetical protein
MEGVMALTATETLDHCTRVRTDLSACCCCRSTLIFDVELLKINGE